MSRTPLNRRPVTQALFAYLVEDGSKVGLVGDPVRVGWRGQPGAAGSTYVPFAVLNPGPASVTEPGLSGTRDWRLPYLLTSYGVDPTQTEELADAVRLRIARWPFEGTTVDTYWRCHHVGVSAMGPITRYEVYDPPIFGQTDTYMIMLTKEDPL